MSNFLQHWLPNGHVYSSQRHSHSLVKFVLEDLFGCIPGISTITM